MTMLPYHVNDWHTLLTATKPAEAMEKKEFSGTIDLLMTTIITPEINGYDLFEKMTDHYQDLRLLFIGYTGNIIALQVGLDDGVAFMLKPFTM